MKALQVLPCGTEIVTKISSIRGIITAVVIKFGTVSYEVGYACNGEYRAAILYESEFTCRKSEKEQIGFKP